MSNETQSRLRAYRCRIEWMRVLTPYEYVLLDKMLFQSNLTYANNGEGFKFHVRTLARETGMSLGKVSQTIRVWPFVKKHGSTKAMTIQMDYPAFEAWIVRRMNNDCSQGEPRSSTEDSTVPDGIVHPLNEGTKNGPSEARVEPEAQPQAIPVVNRAKPVATAGMNGIVHPVNNKKSPRYVAGATKPIPLPMPNRIKPGPSAARQAEILRQLNANGFSFVKDGAMGIERDGFKFAAIDDTEKAILITADDKGYLSRSKVQAMCRHFEELKYHVLLWTKADQCIFNVEKEPKPAGAVSQPPAH